MTEPATAELVYTLYGEPRAWSRPRSNGRRHFTPQSVLNEQERHREAVGLARPVGWPMDATYGMHVVACLGTRRRVDADNLAKLVGDALNGAAFNDDSQVERLIVEKRIDRDDPRTEVRVWLMQEAG